MIIPSIDIQNGEAVQLVGGKTKVISGGDPGIWAEEFSLSSEIAVIDLDAALKKGSNKNTILELLGKYRCRVGGGIRTVEDALFYLNSGARQVIIGTMANLEFLNYLPKDRIIVALDSKDGKVVTEGWVKSLNESVEEKISELKKYVGGFLITLVETEGSLKGIDIKRCLELKELCGDTPLTVAGGINSTDEISVLDKAGIDVQVGMALYTRKFSYADAVISAMKPSDLWPTVVSDERGVTLGLVWSNSESINLAFEEKKGIYFSRSRNQIWRKGETSGAVQKLLRVNLDCDRDSLQFIVEQSPPGFCHTKSYSCFNKGFGITALENNFLIPHKLGSYTKRLLEDEDLLYSKIMEETKELIEAKTTKEIIYEATDLIYFTEVLLHKHGIKFSEVERELDKRALKVSRRGGNKKL